MPVRNLFRSSIGRKALLSLSSVALVGFLIAHLAGNLLVFQGPEAINSYALSLRSYPILLWAARLGLLCSFLVHFFFALQLSIENRRARPQAYIYKKNVVASLASRSMALSGMAMLAYIVYHLLHFTFGVVHEEFFHLKDQLGRHDVYSMIVLSFQNVEIVLAYLAALLLTLAHLSHGVPSLFQSLGLQRKKALRSIQSVAQIFALLLFLGYASIPLAVQAGWLSLS